jgi:hypothetical protein
MKKAFAAVLVPVALWAADVTGTWQFDVQTSEASGSPTFQLRQDGQKLTGTYQGMLGKADVRGTVKGAQVVIEFETEALGTKETVRYTGKLEGTDKISGKVTLGARSGTFTGRKK